MTQQPINLNPSFWDKLSTDHKALYGIVRPLPTPVYTVDWIVSDLERILANQERDIKESGGTFELEPDFQRGHVWTLKQRVAFVESMIRKTAPNRIMFNCPGWTRSTAGTGDIPDNTFQCIDGLQRLTTLRMFLAGEFTVFGEAKLTAQSLKGSPFDLGRLRLQMAVYEFDSRADLLELYLDLNGGGTVHSQEELQRVRNLREAVLRASI
ncbi:DUF262 domain-containing protein [Comamonas sp. w2-DMI]|uniref:DUF262 domain-containing protein n=1 Tax=Comamonas sp. w2-DMI TaxID=3126391 RepID=UPI0032E4CE74